MPTRWQRVARAGAGEDYAARYAARFRALAARGEDVHGEAALVASLLPAPGRVLDAGCGTGRVAIRLHQLGYAVTGVDVDPAMLSEARAEAPALDWREADLATLDLGETYDLVVVAGNTLPLLEDGTLLEACGRLTAHVRRGGLLVTGFGLDEAHLPAGCPPTPLDDVEVCLAASGLSPVDRFGTWAGDPLDPGAGYVVTLDRRPSTASRP